MTPFNVSKIEQNARKLRAEEMQRIQGLMLARLGLYFRLLAASGLLALGALTESVRPLFSWNPQAPGRRASGPGLSIRANRLARALFGWNPQARRSN